MTTVNTFLSDITEKGYSVQELPIPSHVNSNEEELFILSTGTVSSNLEKVYFVHKSTGTSRRDVNGGTVSFDKEGNISYSVFIGGNKYGEHLSTYTDELSNLSFIPLEEGVNNILNFLN